MIFSPSTQHLTKCPTHLLIIIIIFSRAMIIIIINFTPKVREFTSACF